MSSLNSLERNSITFSGNSCIKDTNSLNFSGIVTVKNSTMVSFKFVNPSTKNVQNKLAFSLTVSQFFHSAIPPATKAAIAAITAHTGADIPAIATPTALNNGSNLAPQDITVFPTPNILDKPLITEPNAAINGPKVATAPIKDIIVVCTVGSRLENPSAISAILSNTGTAATIKSCKESIIDDPKGSKATVSLFLRF